MIVLFFFLYATPTPDRYTYAHTLSPPDALPTSPVEKGNVCGRVIGPGRAVRQRAGGARDRGIEFGRGRVEGHELRVERVGQRSQHRSQRRCDAVAIVDMEKARYNFEA